MDNPRYVFRGQEGAIESASSMLMTFRDLALNPPDQEGIICNEIATGIYVCRHRSGQYNLKWTSCSYQAQMPNEGYSVDSMVQYALRVVHITKLILSPKTTNIHGSSHTALACTAEVLSNKCCTVVLSKVCWS